MPTRLVPMGLMLVIGIGIGALAMKLKAPSDQNEGSVASANMVAPVNKSPAPATDKATAPSPESADDVSASALLATRADGADKIADLIELLTQEVSNRRRLERRLAALQSDFWKLEAAVAKGSGASASPNKEEKKEQTKTEEDAEKVSQARFLAAGFDPVTRAQLLKRSSEIEMDRLNLRYQARREGWLRTPEYREQSRQLSQGLRQELGEDLYDRFLFASERTNRLQVESVMESSPAAQTGIQPGDVIYRYDGSRVFSRGDLRDATGRGEMSDTVSVEIRRGGDFFEVELPRGPLGVRLDRTTVQP